ncbi:MAG: hypothetical protein ABJO02_03895 [Reichenbachiella sp.]|uniref:hypothetical protein n=1 Tax=Reichenbachiella sp. TaxID=2184521 RepID=UPI003299D415
MKFGLFFLFLSCCFITSNEVGAFVFEKSDRTFDQKKLEAYKNNSEFTYLHESQTSHWWDGVQEWFANVLNDWFDDANPEGVGNFFYILFRIVLWGLLLFALVMVVYSLYKKGFWGMFSRKKHEIDPFYGELEDQVLETNWQELVEKAILNKQYNIATRLLFLQLLQSLNHSELIIWEKSKSIRDYQKELTDEFKEGFLTLSRYYQYAWFGDVVIDELHFVQIQEEFQSFKANLNVG